MGRSDLAGVRQKWMVRMRRFSRCRTTVSAFCEQEQVSVAAFYHWRRKLAELEGRLQERKQVPVTSLKRPEPFATGGFVPVKLLQSASIEVRLVNGVSLSLPTGDIDLLRQTLVIVSQLRAESPSLTEGSRC